MVQLCYNFIMYVGNTHVNSIDNFNKLLRRYFLNYSKKDIYIELFLVIQNLRKKLENNKLNKNL